ncbi:hypothetical protein, partial [Microbulbifer thermotolerans]|uniref:hypothetical protein n=1 Tax=Microbulbifer thermotolerans TaxID=252514 RepID=UPI00224B9B88
FPVAPPDTSLYPTVSKYPLYHLSFTSAPEEHLPPGNELIIGSLAVTQQHTKNKIQGLTVKKFSHEATNWQNIFYKQPPIYNKTLIHNITPIYKVIHKKSIIFY